MTSPTQFEPTSEFTLVLDHEDETDLETGAYRSQFAYFWRRFSSHRLAVVGLVILAFMILMAIFAPLITPGVGPYTSPAFELNVPLFAVSHPPTTENFPWRLFGTTNLLNNSVLAQVTYGARLSLFISFTGAILSAVIGTALGAIAGYFGGWLDMLIMRFTDIMLSIPLLPLLVASTAIFAKGSIVLIIAIFGLFTWPSTTRFVQAQFLSLREREFTQAAKAAGVNEWRIIFRHLLPNALSPVIVITTLNLAAFLTLESTVDFLSLGVHQPAISWGLALSQAEGDILAGDWWWALFPGLFLLLTVLAVSFIGDGLQDAFNVRNQLEQ
jgi:peptide/nickel transport system permease protein